MFKPPKVDPEKYQIEIDGEYYLGKRERYKPEDEVEGAILVYQN